MGTNEGEEEEEEGEGEFVIPPEQYEQDMQAEDEQYIQAGNDGLSGQQATKPFWCNSCAKTFSSQSKLKQHMLVHSEEKPFSCTVCERAFNVVSNLRRHMRTVHKEVEGPLQLKFDQLH